MRFMCRKDKVICQLGKAKLMSEASVLHRIVFVPSIKHIHIRYSW